MKFIIFKGTKISLLLQENSRYRKFRAPNWFKYVLGSIYTNKLVAYIAHAN